MNQSELSQGVFNNWSMSIFICLWSSNKLRIKKNMKKFTIKNMNAKKAFSIFAITGMVFSLGISTDSYAENLSITDLASPSDTRPEGYATLMGIVALQHWAEEIAIPTGFEAEGIELGELGEFFLGGFSFSSVLVPAFGGPAHPMSEYAGAIFKGNLRNGEGAILVPPTGKPISGLSYDPRTDYLYAATGFADLVNGIIIDQGVIVYDASSGDFITEITFGDNILINDCLVTDRAVYCTDSFNPDLYKIVLGEGGRLPSTPVFEVIPMPGFEMTGFVNANGLVGDFDGKQLVIVNIDSGVLYLVDTASGEASPIEIEGAEQLFVDGDGLYLSRRTLYIMQNFTNKIAVVQLSGDLSGGEFIKNIPGEGEINPLDVATSIIGFGNRIYAINTHFWEYFGEFPDLVQTEVVRLRK